jgi:hypothetical protein
MYVYCVPMLCAWINPPCPNAFVPTIMSLSTHGQKRRVLPIVRALIGPSSNRRTMSLRVIPHRHIRRQDGGSEQKFRGELQPYGACLRGAIAKPR